MKKLLIVFSCFCLLMTFVGCNTSSIITSDSESTDVTLDYDKLIQFPPQRDDGTYGIEVRYLCYFPSQDAYALFSRAYIREVEYEYTTVGNQLLIELAITCYVKEKNNRTEYMAFEVLAYNSDNARIVTAEKMVKCNQEEKIKTTVSMLVALSDVEKGIRIEFSDYKA